MKKTQRLLNYWYNLEFFSPFWPEKTKDTIYIIAENKKLPWLIMPDSKFKYDVYLGKIKSQDLIIKMLKSIGEQDNTIEKDNSQSCVCAFKLTADGTYIGNSFSVSTFVWAVAKIITERNLRTDLNATEIEKLNNEMNDVLSAIGDKIEYKDLEKVFADVMEKLHLKLNDYLFSAVINKKYAKKENTKEKAKGEKQETQDEEEDVNVNTDMLSSFYISDIDIIKRNIQTNDKIIKFIEALIKPSVNRIEIDTDVLQMKKWLSPAKYPLGKWPSTNSPSLMQQMAINLAISDDSNVFSVNGPPGTGKTTLLKEIIASYMVERALLLSEYENPDNAFHQCKFKSSENNYLKSYYKPDAKLTKYGIVVASNNNSAVENISKELPIAEDVKKSNTTLFNVDVNREIYFSDIANSLRGNNETCWGLISARLGKKSNINELKQALWFNKEGVNLQQYFKDELPDWEQAKQIFKSKYAEVLKYRRMIEDAVLNTDRHTKITEERNHAERIMSEARNRMEEQENLLGQKVEEGNNLKVTIQALEQNITLLCSRLSFLKRIFPFLFRKDPIIIQIKQTKQELDSVTIKLTAINLEISKSKIKLDELKATYSNAQRYFEEKETAFINSSQQIERYKEQFGRNFAGEEFWSNIEKNESSQLASPWTDKKYDMLREELFYYALRLQKAFILNSKCVKQNLKCLINMWTNSFSEKDKELGYSHLLNTLFLVVPVVSTTFAAVSTFLKHIGKNELGTLIIDEAGQATPYSALGALWRTNKAIIVGDPLQVEPVVTVPKELSKRFTEEFQIDEVYRPQELSVQVLADSINSYGGYREYSGGKLWLGCPLVVHRRCLDPMFKISNEVAYNNRMFKQSMEPKADVLLSIKNSEWLDIKGKEIGDKDHFVPEQGDKVIEMVLNAFTLKKGFPNIYIISPFKTVTNNIKILLKKNLRNHFRECNWEDIDNWVEKSCGTVHTFQGKEANEVIFILGCDTKSAGAAEWAGKKPNILNVAVTRAKYRIAIIGDSDVWRAVPNFDFAYRILCKNY